ncbi:MAG: hypothetical protein ACE366_02315 [Bradymonadia bacterium]
MKKTVDMWRLLAAPALAAMCLVGCDSEDAGSDATGGAGGEAGMGGVAGGGAGGEAGMGGGVAGAGGEAGMGGGGAGGEAGMMGGAGGGEPGVCGAGVDVVDLNAEGANGGVWRYSGATSGDDFSGSCSNPQASHTDAVFQFTAAEAGLYIISTGESAGADTVLYVRTDCTDAGTELACNDDISQMNLASSVAVNMEADQTGFIVVDSFEGGPTDFTLTVELSNAEAPSIDTIEAFYNEADTVLAFRATGTDAEADISAFRLTFLDENGADLPFGDTGSFQAGFDEVGFATIDQSPDGFTMEFSAGLPEELAGTRGVRLVLIDGLGLESEPAEAQTQAPAVLGSGDDCDPVGGFNVCPEGEACINREDPAGPTACTTATAPVLGELEGFYNPNANGAAAVAWTALGTDAENDVSAFQVFFLDENGAVIPGLSEDGSFSAGFDEVGFAEVEQADGDFIATFSAQLPEDFAVVASIRVIIFDVAGLQSNDLTIELGATPVVANGEPCDSAGGFSACGEGDFCLDRTEDGEENFVCSVATAPTITMGQGYGNDTTGAFGATFEGIDGEGDVVAARVVLLNANGSPILIDGQQGPVPAEFETGVQVVAGEEGAYQAAFGVFLGDAVNLADVGAIEVTAIDIAGLESEATELAVIATPEVESGGACDEAGALGICPEGELCGVPAEGELLGACGVPVVECPEAFGEIGDLNAAMTGEGVWSVMGDSTEAANIGGAGTCGGGGPQVIYAFTAPAAGDYLVEIDGEGDTLLFARQFCGYSAEVAELACNDDIDTQGGNFLSAMTMTLEADQAAYIFVDGFVGQGAAGFAAPFTLTVTAQ